MAEFTTTGQYVPRGIGDVNHFTVKAVVPSAMVTSDTFVVTLEQQVPRDVVPLALVVATRSGSVYTNIGNLDWTSHNRTTGKTTFTASGSIAAGAGVMIHYGTAPG